MSRCCCAAAKLASAEVPFADEVVVGGAKGRGAEERSARLWEALLADMRSRPRSSRRERMMALISVGERRGLEQKVQGPMPSFTQTIFPQLRQLGAAARRGWRVALQGQARERAESSEREGLVWSSRVRMAESC